MPLKRRIKIAACAAGGTVLILMAVVPLGDSNSNIGFWLGAVGFDRLGSILSSQADFWVAAAGFFVVAAAAVILLLPLISKTRIRSGRGSPERRSRVEQRLLDSKWVLVYDPEDKQTKPLTFNPDGTIGEGRNKNEYSWAVSGNYLEIFRESGILHNRFELHASGDRLNFVRDPRAMGTEGQYIHRVGRRVENTAQKGGLR